MLQIALVDEHERVHLNIYVRPDRPVVSYLTALTGLTGALLEEEGISIEEALEVVKETLPKVRDAHS